MSWDPLSQEGEDSLSTRPFRRTPEVSSISRRVKATLDQTQQSFKKKPRKNQTDLQVNSLPIKTNSNILFRQQNPNIQWNVIYNVNI